MLTGSVLSVHRYRVPNVSIRSCIRQRGTVIGALTGFYGGLLDDGVMRIIDVLFSIPSILLALVFVSLSDFGMTNVILALGIAVIPSFAKMIRTEFKEQAKLEYVQAAKLMGASDFRILFRHILPNVMPTLVNCMFISLTTACLPRRDCRT